MHMLRESEGKVFHTLINDYEFTAAELSEPKSARSHSHNPRRIDRQERAWRFDSNLGSGKTVIAHTMKRALDMLSKL